MRRGIALLACLALAGCGTTTVATVTAPPATRTAKAKAPTKKASPRVHADAHAAELRKRHDQEVNERVAAVEAQGRLREQQNAQGARLSELEASQEAEHEESRIAEREQECLVKTGVRGC
jgi:hypothetical protein